MARLDNNPYPVAPWTIGGNPMAGQLEQLAELARQTEELPEGKVVGALLSFQTADSYAYYVVTSANPLTVQHADFIDGWSIPAAHVRGLNKADVLEQINRTKAIARLRAEREAS